MICGYCKGSRQQSEKTYYTRKTFLCSLECLDDFLSELNGETE